MSKINIKKTNAKSILVKSNLPEADYVINPYTGCLHGCRYCYASFMKRFTKHKEPWGEFIDIKINAPEILEKDIKNIKKGTVLLSSVTDPYNPIDVKYKLTRKILKILLKHKFPISILTKSDLILRDIDLLKQFKDCSVGFSLFSLDNKDINNFEKRTIPVKRRLKALKILKNNNITTYVMISPMFPYITNINKIIKELKKIPVDFIFCENYNIKSGTKNTIFNIIKNKYPNLINKYNTIFKNKDYWKKEEKNIQKLAKEYNIPIKVFFNH